MGTQFIYRLPVEQTRWSIEGQTTTSFTWEGFEDMGVLELADVDSAAMLENDQRVADELDARRLLEFTT